MRKIAALAVLLVVTVTSMGVGTAHALGQNSIATITTTSKLAAPAAKTVSKVEAKPVVEQPAAPAPEPVIVTVQAGDTLSSIATANNTTYVRIFNANDSLTNPNVINTGQQLRIPTADEQLPDRMPVAVAPAPVATTTTTATRRVAAAPQSYPAVTGSDAKAFIYSHESGNNPNATNPNGCYGLGQDCNGVVRARCGADYACQDEYFTGYMQRRYGSWENAVAFWQAHRWW